jgi:hypothetical protein
MAVNKGIAFRLLVRFGEKSFGDLGRLLPGVGGLIGGGIDAFLMRGIGQRARREFTAVDATDASSRTMDS